MGRGAPQCVKVLQVGAEVIVFVGCDGGFGTFKSQMQLVVGPERSLEKSSNTKQDNCNLNLSKKGKKSHFTAVVPTAHRSRGRQFSVFVLRCKTDP